MDIIINNPNKPWNWSAITANPNITMDIIINNPNKPWDWSAISRNPNITLEFIEKNKEKIELCNLSGNKFLWNDTVYKREIAKDIRRRVEYISDYACVPRTNASACVCRDLMRVIARYIDWA